jgi:hypothetical protein
MALGTAVVWLVQRLREQRQAAARPEPAGASGAPGGWSAVEPPSAVPEVRAPVVPVVEPEPVAVGDVEAPGEPAVEEPAPSWVVPEPGGACPASHPVKGKLKSKLYHLPGMFAYDRTNPDRCYADEAAAEADGLRRAKR